VPDFPPSGPPPGWYPDPADPTQERFWGGSIWTHNVRPRESMPAPTPAAAPAFAAVPGGGVNPFEAEDAAVAARSSYDPSAPALASTSSLPTFTGATPTADWHSGFGGQSGFVESQSSPFDASASWYDSSRRAPMGPPPTNGVATAGLVFALLGWNLVGLILSILGLRKAREFEAMGELPVGRKRSRWGLGLSIASMVISIALTVMYVLFFQAVVASYLEELARDNTTVTEEWMEPDKRPLDSNGAPYSSGGDPDDGTYNRDAYVQEIMDEYAWGGLLAPDMVECPETGSTAPGAVIVCRITTGTQVDIRTAEYLDDGGYSIFTITQ
jgi:uncharacterized membrane protein (DUF485 family)